jgi:hypothetical protein
MFFLFKKPDNVSDLAKMCNRPWKLGLWLWNRIWYKKDINLYNKNDYWATPEETLKNMSGDCDDFAKLARRVLQILGYNAFMMCLFNKKEGHATCVYYDVHKNRYNTICNWGHRKGSVDYHLIPGRFYKDWDHAYIVDDNDDMAEFWKNQK